MTTPVAHTPSRRRSSLLSPLPSSCRQLPTGRVAGRITQRVSMGRSLVTGRRHGAFQESSRLFAASFLRPANTPLTGEEDRMAWELAGLLLIASLVVEVAALR